MEWYSKSEVANALILRIQYPNYQTVRSRIDQLDWFKNISLIKKLKSNIPREDSWGTPE